MVVTGVFVQFVNAQESSTQQLIGGSYHMFYHDQVTSVQAQQDQRSPLLPRAHQACE